MYGRSGGLNELGGSSAVRTGPRGRKGKEMSKKIVELGIWVACIAALGSCRENPCGDRSARLPAALNGLPVVLDGGQVCSVSDGAMSQDAQIMYWGDAAKLEVEYRMLFARRGWDDCSPPLDPMAGPQSELCFERGKDKLSLTVVQSETPTFGSEWKAPSVHVLLNFYGDA